MYKPCILIGNGLRNNPALVAHLCSLGIPIMLTWMSLDLVAEDNPAFCGRPGVFGQRAANIIQDKATVMYCLGARLDGEQTAHDYSRFAPNAKKIVYDVDQAELDKLPGDWWKYLEDFSAYPPERFFLHGGDPAWLNWCKALYTSMRPELDGDTNGKDGYIGTKEFISELSKAARPDDLLAVGSSSGAVNTFLQTFKVKAGQRVTVCASIGAMGADIGMAIGGAMATGKRTICVTGDGGFQLNAQELAVVSRLGLPIKFFVFSNNGYQSIRAMQDVRFAGRHVGCDPASGFTIAPIQGLAECYGVPYFKMDNEADMSMIPYLLQGDYPRIIEVMVDPDWRQFPKVGSTLAGTVYTVDAMHNMTPHMPADELKALMEWDG